MAYWVNLFRTDYDWGRQAWGDWQFVYQGWASGGTYQPLGTEHGLVASSCYTWRVFSVDLSYQSQPWYVASDWSVFCAK